MHRHQSITSGRSVRHFYQGEHLATQISSQGDHISVFSAQAAALVQRCAEGAQLLQVNQPGSVLGVQRVGRVHGMAYAPYGHRSDDRTALLGFNGQWCEDLTKGYLLGNGHRLYAPGLMRFNSPDSLSPFGHGGVNAYAYCNGDPVSYSDPSGTKKVKTGFTKAMKENDVSRAQRGRAKYLLRETMQAMAEEKGTYWFMVEFDNAYVKVSVADGKFSYQRKQSFELRSDSTLFKKDGIVVGLGHVPPMPAGKGFSSKMDPVFKEKPGARLPMNPEIAQEPTPEMIALRSGSATPSAGEA